MANKNLNAAKEAKKDEFYTQLSDIENELRHYREHFRGKTVFCNCDDPYESNFFKYFASNFNALGLKKLIATCYNGSPILGNELLLKFDDADDEPKKIAYKVEITEVKDENGDGRIDLAEAFKALKDAKLVPTGNKTDIENGVWESVTGELCMNQPLRRLTVDTPRLQGMTAVKGDSYRFKDVIVRNLGIDAGVALASIDGEKPLKDAKRILLVFATDAVNSEAIYMNRFREDIKPKMGWPKQLGHAPILIETGSVEIGLRNANAKKLKLWALNVDGTRAEEIPVTATANAIKFKLDTAKLKAPSVYFELAEE